MRRMLTVAFAALVMLAVAPAAEAAKRKHKVTLDTAVFANTVGSLTNGGSVLAGATEDPRLGHGAVVISIFGTTSLRGTFQVFYTDGSIRGTGTGTLTPGATSGAAATFAGSFTVTGGGGKYKGAKGKFTASGTVQGSGMVMATAKGSFSY